MSEQVTEPEEVPVEPEEANDYPGDTPQEFPVEGLGAPGDAPRTAAEAIDVAKKMSRDRTYVGVGMCLATVRGYYGVEPKYPSAERAWYAAEHKHTVPSSKVPRGVPVFWTNGRYGHVAISLGNGLCLSTDWKENGRIDVARIDDITRRWGQTFRGYTNDLNGVIVWRTPHKPVVSLRNLRFGKRNDDILQVKKALRRHGYGKKMKVTGKFAKFFGPGLRGSYKRWQEHLGYRGRDADGKPGRTSLEKLGFKVKR